MSFALFLHQVQILMDTQQMKIYENSDDKNTYDWLRNKKYDPVWISLRQEYLIRQSLSKISADDQTKAIKELVNYIEKNMDLDPTKIPEICIGILNKMINFETVRRESLRRASTFRRSLRLSITSNRVSPTILLLPNTQMKQQKSVKFSDNTQIYSISY